MNRRTPIEATNNGTVHVTHWAVYRMALIKIGGLELAAEAHHMLKQGLPFTFEGTVIKTLTESEKRNRYD